MKAKEFIPASKPRNFVAKNQKTGGAGAHKDKKKAEKQGDVKHKNKQFEEDVEEGWKSKVAATALAAANLLGSPAAHAKEPVKPITIAYVKIDGEVRKYNLGDKFDNAKEAEKFISGVLDKQGLQGYTLDIKHGYPKKKDESVAERVRDPEDWDEGNTEPPNNFAVYINGKKWKVFKGRGQFADDYKEIQHYRQLQNWAQAKSQATGKKWEVHRTGEQATEDIDEGWKEKLAAAGLAATIGLGAAGGAHARVLPGADPSINRFTGEPVAAQQVKPSDEKKDSAERKFDFSTEYLKKVADGKHPRPMISVDDAKKELERRGEL